ncbi:hypothetical protein Pelo_15808 [Pelomyxa schiedti]|nr:hypothetical protein Pelo_15808 [Pelomyxa schiedti]
MSVDIIIDAHGPTIGVLSASRSTLNNNNSNVAGVSVRAGTGGGLLGASSGSLQLRAIATPIIDPGRGDSEGGKRLAGACPLTVIVPVVAVVIVVSIVTACLAPMTSLWVTSLNTMKSTCASSLSQEMNVYRKLLVDKSVTSITTEMWIPPTVGSILKIGIPESVYTSAVPLHVDRSGFQMTVRGLARQFRAINNIILSWTNYEGDHLYGDWQTYWGLYDSNVDSNITMYWFDGDTPTDQRKGGDILNYNLTLRDWWVVGVTAWNGSWTSVYKSANKADGRVIAYTIRPPVSVPVVIQVTLSISFLSDFFTNFNLTKNGVSFLVEDKTLDLVSGTPGITILTEDGETISATQSPDQTVRDTAGMWLNLTSELFVESHFKMADTDGMLFVDVVPIKASGGLVLWLFLVTPENDFMGEIESEQARTVSRAYLSLWSVLGIEIFIGMVAVVTSMTLSLVLARALTAVIRKLQKVSRGQLEKSESNKDLKRSMLREIDSYS